MKRYIAVILRTLVIVLVGSIVILAGYGKQEASTVYKLKLATYHGKTYWAWPIYESLAKTVEEKSGGRLQIQLFGSQSLVKAAATHDAIISGVTDMGFIPASYFPGAFELQQVWDLPPMHSTAVEGTMWYKQLDDEFFKEKMFTSYTLIYTAFPTPLTLPFKHPPPALTVFGPQSSSRRCIKFYYHALSLMTSSFTVHLSIVVQLSTLKPKTSPSLIDTVHPSPLGSEVTSFIPLIISGSAPPVIVSSLSGG